MQPSEDRSYIVNAALVSLLIIAVYIPAITVTGELVPPLKNWLATTYGHHWVGKGIIMMIVYAVVFLFSMFIYKIRKSETTPVSLVTLSGFFAAISSLVLTLFFIYEFFAHTP